MVKVGLIGLGFMGSTHFKIYQNLSNAKIVAVADFQKKRLEGDWSDIGGNIGDGSGKVNLSGIATYSDPMDLINDSSVEYVDICLPTDLHLQYAVAALKAGKHVITEKPMVLNTKQADVLVKAAAKAKGYFMVAHCIRFWPEYAVTQELIKSGKYGKVKELFLRRVVSPGHRGYQDWLLKEKRSGGALLDLHIHDIDYALFLCGKPKKVWAWGAKGPSGGIDIVHAGYEFSGGVHANIIGGWGYLGKFPFNMEFCIRTDKATFTYNMAAGKPLTIYTADGKEIVPKVPAGTGWDREIEYFVNCVDKKKKPTIVTAKSSFESVKMAEYELKSIKEGKAVVVK
jgi:predicted dehydrogenase